MWSEWRRRLWGLIGGDYQDLTSRNDVWYGALAQSAEVTVEALEERVLLSRVGPLVDAGDQRWLSSLNRPEHLLRATDLVLVGFEPSSTARLTRLTGALRSKPGALAGYRILQSYDDPGVTSVLFERTARGPAPSLGSLQSKIAGFPAVKHLSPTFFSLPDWKRVVVFDRMYIDLRAGVDPAPVFRKGFLNNWSPAGVNAYHATIKHGGAIDALRVAEKLRTESYVEAAEATIASEIILSATTPDDDSA